MASSLDIKKFQMIHNQKQTGVMTPSLMTAIKGVQAKNGLSATGLIDSGTLALYKRLWPYAWGLNSSGGSTNPNGSNGNYGSAFNPEPMLDKLIGGILLFGIFKVLMKVF